MIVQIHAYVEINVLASDVLHNGAIPPLAKMWCSFFANKSNSIVLKTKGAQFDHFIAIPID